MKVLPAGYCPGGPEPYLVTNPGPLFGGRRIVFRSSAPAGRVVPLEVDGRPVRALLTAA
ncbi:hypothetical protein [Streptomyces mirabilis]|uniref:hypothetical protein n=1 Tax=Streptomyces mirabilis TaxID=68239 RepID=UPI00369CEE53